MNIRIRYIVATLCVIFSLPILPLLTQGLPLTHDGKDHVARIANFYQTLSEGNIVPRWGENLNWGYGHPVLQFLYPLPSYAASIFHAIGFSYVDSMKAVVALSFIASGVFMYLFASGEFGRRAGVFISLLYCFAPYRFVDMTVRGAIGEHIAFVFLPLALFFLHKSLYLSLAVFLLILSHNALSILFLAIILFWRGFPSRGVLTGVLLGFALSAFFWIPAYAEGKYTLRDIVTAGEFSGRYVPLHKFITPDWNFGQGNDLTKFLGYFQIAGIVGYLYLFVKKIGRKKLMLTFAILLVSVYIQTSVSEPVWNAITILQKFQFPWRFMSVSVFASSLVAGYFFAWISGKIYDNNMRNLFGAAVIIGIIAASSYMWKPQRFIEYKEEYFTGVYPGTTDTGESSPIWSVRFMEHGFQDPLEVIAGDAQIIQTERMTTLHTYSVDAEIPSRFVENTLYFPGWNVYVNGEKTDIQFQDPAWRGLMTFDVPAGSHDISVRFEKTKVRSFAELFSLITLIGIIGTAVFKFRHPDRPKAREGSSKKLDSSPEYSGSE